MDMRGTARKLSVATALAVLLVGGAALAATATSDGSTTEAERAEDRAEVDTPITGNALDRASAAALEHTGEGRVTGTEVGDEESYYEIEVQLDDGRQVDVQLDQEFQIVGDELESRDD